MIKRGVLQEHAKFIAFISTILNVAIVFFAGILSFKICFNQFIFFRPYWVLMLFSAFLSAHVFPRFAFQSSRGQESFFILKKITLSWFLVVLILVLFGFFTKTTGFFSR